MSRFYGTFNSDCTKQSSKRGHNYVSTHVRGWDFGVSSVVLECPHCGADMISVEVTSGSNASGSIKPGHRRKSFTLCSADCQK